MERIYTNRTTEVMAAVTPAWQILEILPDSCQSCVKILPKVDELAFWVDEGRLSLEKAVTLLLEKAGCRDPEM